MHSLFQLAATGAYFIVPFILVVLLLRPGGWRYDILGVTIHLAFAAIRRGFIEIRPDNASFWSNIHATTIIVALCLIAYEVIYARSDV